MFFPHDLTYVISDFALGRLSGSIISRDILENVYF